MLRGRNDFPPTAELEEARKAEAPWDRVLSSAILLDCLTWPVARSNLDPFMSSAPTNHTH